MSGVRQLRLVEHIKERLRPYPVARTLYYYVYGGWKDAIALRLLGARHLDAALDDFMALIDELLDENEALRSEVESLNQRLREQP